jgi:type IV pilus assembly protein PilA
MRKIRERIREERGFTLTELLIVVLVVCILAAIAIPGFVGQQEKAKDAQAKSAVRNAAMAMEAFYTDGGTYAGADKATLKAIEPSLNEVDDADMTVVPSDLDGYTLAVKQAETGNEFAIANVGGVRARACTVNSKGGCPADGYW